MGGVKIAHSDIVKLPTYFAAGVIPVTHGIPPYDYFAIKPKVGRIPIHRTDVGLVVERPCLAILQNSEVIEQLHISNGMVPGNITRALNGEQVGTYIYKQ